MKEITFEDDDRIIKVTKTVVEVMWHQLQITTNSPESGGILVGRENMSNNNFIIEFATAPMADDIRKRTRYIRKDKGHLNFIRICMIKIMEYIDMWANGILILRKFPVIRV